MRPLHLSMTAFGSYAETAVLPFEELKHGLYLVTGDTGAGKTTIFDAIMFALYGVASGRDRKGDMLHCDHVSRAVDTEVSLRFLQNGKEYTVTRKIHFSKKRGAEGQYNPGTLSAVLLEPDRDPTEGSERVTERCEELLGLNSEQFRKIIMLAQGEFKEFLKADSDKKNEILGKLFDNSSYLWMQNLLIQARGELGERRKTCADRQRQLMQSAFLPPKDLTAAEREAFLPDHPELCRNLRCLIGKETEELAERRAEREAVDESIGRLNIQKGAAETMNLLLDELERQTERLTALEAADADMKAREERMRRAEAALHRAMPAAAEADRTEAELRATLAAIEEGKQLVELFARDVEAAQQALSADDQAAKEAESADARIRAIAEQLPHYRELAQSRIERDRAMEALLAAQRDITDRREKLSVLDKEICTLQNTLDDMSGVDAEEQEAAWRFDQANDKWKALAGKKGVGEELQSIREGIDSLEETERHLLMLTWRAGDCVTRYDRLYQRFISAQAGLLAEGLRRELAEKDEVECPVCRTRISRGGLSQLAPLPQETPGEAEVEAAKKAAELAEGERSRCQSEVQAQRAALRARKEALLDRAAVLLPDCTGWEQLCAEGYLKAAVARARTQAAEAEKKRREAELRRQERERSREDLAKKTEAFHKLQSELTELQERAQEQNTLAHEADASIKALQKQLYQDSEQTAEQEKRALEAKKTALLRLIRNHEEAVKEARQSLDHARGSLEEKQNALGRLREAADTARADLAKALAETGFDSREAAERALAPIGGGDGESWLAAERRALSEHQSEKKHVREQIDSLRTQTAGRQRTQLDALEQRLAQLSADSAEAAARCSELKAALSNHAKVLEQVEETSRELAATEGPWRRLDRLASLAGGVNSESGKLSFDRYVMGAVFREILEMANRRMELMSGGRYELVHKVGAERRNAKAGLDIEVLDNSTGLQRSAASLSGGETFFASLALALGLSDAVQNHAGGKQMDALFIDEGFGTLSDDVLDKALDVLNQLSEGRRLVGIISHVDRLDESIPQKIRVKNGDKGSVLSLELA